MISFQKYVAFFLVGVAALGLPLHFLAPQQQTAVFPLRLLSKGFISSYGDRDVIHRVLYFGLFGFDRKLAEADVIIGGTSHAELGISAMTMSRTLTEKLGRPVKVVNMAMGWGEPLPFSMQVIRKRDIRCKAMIFDLYYTLSPQESEVAGPTVHTNKISAISNILDTWLAVVKDWMLDGALPRIWVWRGKVQIERYLSNVVGVRRWNNGDVYEYWHPRYGSVYRHTPAELLKDPQVGSTTDNIMDPTLAGVIKNGDVTAEKRTLDIEEFTRRLIDPTFTIVPYKSYQLDGYELLANQLKIPLVIFPIGGIKMYDFFHTNSDGRELVTERIVENWMKNPDLPVSTALGRRDQCRRQ
jgi:hypothetical protein